MKRTASIIIALAAFLMPLRAQQEVMVDQVVGVVGKNIVKLSDVENAYRQVRIQKGLEKAQEYRCNIFESLLINKLMLHKGDVDSLTVPDEQVEQTASSYMKNTALRVYGSKEAIYNMTGYTYEELYDVIKGQVRDQYICEKVQNGLTENVKITPAEVRAYFESIPADSLPMMEEKYELSEIDIQPVISEEERDRVRVQLAELRERVLKGEKFAMLATLYSQDPGSSKKGGETGFFSRGDMVSEFEAAAFALKPGEVSPIVETQYGFHIIQLIERRGNSLNVRHILLMPKVNSGDMLQVRVKLDSLANEIQSGSITFEEAAKKFSTGQGRSQGGIATNPNTGSNRFSKEDLAAFYPGISIANMNEGDISTATAMKDQDNKDLYRLVKLTKKMPAHKANLTDDYDFFYDAALQAAKQKKVLDWASRMIKNTYIRISPEFQDCDFQLDWMKSDNVQTLD